MLTMVKRIIAKEMGYKCGFLSSINLFVSINVN